MGVWFVFRATKGVCHPGGGGRGQDAGKTAGNHGQCLTPPPQKSGQAGNRLIQPPLPKETAQEIIPT